MGRNTILALSFFLCGLTIGCGGPKPIVVGAKNFTEQFILGELIAQQIERCAGLPVERKFGLGGALLAHQAITSGEIDLYPEYTGTALASVVKESPAGRTKEQVLARVREVYRERYGVEWLEPLGFENTFAMAVPGDLARKHGLRTLSDAVRSGLAFRLGVGYEFEQRPDGLPGLRQVYPLKLDGTPQAMDLGLLYRAIEQGQVDLVAGNSTDGAIASMGLVVLEDDQRFFPPYEAAVLVRKRVLEQHAPLRGCLEGLAGRVTVEAMRRANRIVESGGVTEREAAAGLLP
jgi:glycine betaine/choline ABC-type transport system substrate-binding protein